MVIELIEEAAKGFIQSPSDLGIEDTLGNLILWLKLFVEIIGAVLIGVGAVIAVGRLAKVFRSPSLGGYENTRLGLARFLSLALEFQLAADILATAVSPSWAQVGKLGAIAVIRTALNFFLAREMKEEQEEIAAELGGTQTKINS